VPGGTGETFDWTFLEGHRRGDVPLILSGGLTPENVGAAIETVSPFAVDVSSGVESAPGVKDADKLAAFFAAAKAATPARKPREDGPATGAEEEVLTLEYTRRIQAEREAGAAPGGENSSR
jgi:phosphoribosylanthranilate isomerase